MICIASFANFLKQHIVDYLGMNDTPGYRVNVDDRIMIPDAVAHKFGKNIYPKRYPKKYSWVHLKDYAKYEASRFDTPHNFIVFQEEDSACVAGTYQFRHDILPLRSMNNPKDLNDILVLKGDKQIFVFNLKRLVATFVIDADGADIEIDGVKFKARLASFYDMRSIIDKFKIAGYDVAYAETPLDILKHDRVLFELKYRYKHEDGEAIYPKHVILENPTSDKFVIACAVYNNPTKKKIGRKRNAIIVDNMILLQRNRKDTFVSETYQCRALTSNYIIIRNELYSLSNNDETLKTYHTSEFLKTYRASFEFGGNHKVVLKDTKTNEIMEINNLSQMYTDDFFGEPQIVQIDDLKFEKPVPLNAFQNFPEYVDYDSYRVFYEPEIKASNNSPKLIALNPIVVFYKDGKIVGAYTFTWTYVGDKPISGNTFALVGNRNYDLVTIKGDRLELVRSDKEKVLNSIQARIPRLEII